MNASADESDTINPSTHSVIIPVIEEQLMVDKKTIETGKVTISKKVEERNEIITVSLLRERIHG